MKTTKKILSILLAILMIATSVPFAFAADDDCDHVYDESGQCTICYEWCPNYRGHYTMEGNVCPICKYSKLSYSLTSNGVTTEYVSFSDAIAEAKDGDTIKMLKNTAPFGGKGTIDKAIIFDLNGHSFETGGSDSVTINANVTFTDSSADKSGYFGYGLVLMTPCKIESGNFWYLKNKTDSKYADFLATPCTKYCNSGGSIIDPDNGDDLWNFSVKSSHTPKNNFDGICSVCDEFYGTELSLGDNAISKNYARMWNQNKYALKFVPTKTGAYLVKVSKTGKYYSLDSYDADLNFLDGDYSDKNDYTGSGNYDYYAYYNLEQGKTYYFTLQTSDSENKDAVMTISLVCEHSGTTATCKGYICDKCGRYFGEKGEHKLGTEQTCRGYKCEYCWRYFGETAPNNHKWETNGYCSLCYTAHDHTGFIVDGLCSVCKYQMAYSVTTDGVTEYYSDIVKAIADAKDSSVVKLLKDVNLWENILTFDKAITFDFNGHKLDQSSSYQLYVKANVIFMDSVGTGGTNYRVKVYSPCTLRGGEYYILDIVTEDNPAMDGYDLESLLAPCAKYYDEDGNEYDFSAKSLARAGGGTAGTAYMNLRVKETHTIEESFAVAATCTSTGLTAGKYCTKCDYYKTGIETIEALGHNFTDTQEKFVTCLEDGNSAYRYCETCKKYFDENADVKALGGADTNKKYIIAATGHNFVDEIAQAIKADCLNAGYKECKKCTKCKDYFEVDEDIYSENGKGIDVFIEMATGHKFGDTVEVKAVTCYEDGVKTAYKQCERCKLYFDESANIASKDGKADNSSYIIKTNGHNYSTINVVKPTCTEQGYTEHICVCGKSYKDTYVDASGHSYVNGTCSCGAKDPNYKDGDNTATDCDCICHSSSSFVQFIFKIVNWFWKILGWHKTCDCGAAHY